MISNKKSNLLFIEPSDNVSNDPLIDNLTRRMVTAWRKRTIADGGFLGWHTCVCGAMSDADVSYVIGRNKKYSTNSLCVHYLACHREEIPTDELEKVMNLPDDEAEPTNDEIQYPIDKVFR